MVFNREAAVRPRREILTPDCPRRPMQIIVIQLKLQKHYQRQPNRRRLMVLRDRRAKDQQHHADREDDLPVRMTMACVHRRPLIRGHWSSSLRHRVTHNVPPDTLSIAPSG